MSQTAALHELFRANGNKLTGLEIWNNWRTVGRKYTSRISDLRAELEKKGGALICEENKDNPEQNLYTLIEPPVLDGKQFAWDFIQPSLGER